MIAVIDVTGNNLASLANAIERLGFDYVLTHDCEQIKQATHVILPGVSTAAPAMQALQDCKLVEVIQQLTQPVLGICLGMQLFFEHSEEGDVACLGLLKGRVRRLPDRAGYPVPHMGWNRLQWCKSSPLHEGIEPGSYVYFVHAFAVKLGEDTLASCQYSTDFSVVVQKNNFYGMQFHPEKSAETGLALLKNFLTLGEIC